ncbi:MAG: hypothetical protein MJZ34_10175 [Paludibacteraceae bacterium]|nr:hypothetical protein [Paludibacteraceae bacterium]
MKLFRFFFFPLLFISLSVSAQEMGTWKTFFSYNKIDYVTQSKDKIYALGDGVLFSVDKKNESLQTYTKADGLSDGYISQIAYNETLDAIIIGYDNSNIDIIKGKKIINISDFKRKEINSKQIHSITTYGKLAYLACELGIVVVDMQKNEIADTYIIGDNGNYLAAYKVEIIGNTIYALTPEGIRSANIKDSNLADFSKWTEISSINSKNTATIAQFNGQLILVDKDSISIFNDDQSLTKIQDIHDFKSISTSTDALVFSAGDSVFNYDSKFQLKEIVFVDYCKHAIYTSSSNSYWIARAENYYNEVYKIYNLFKYKGGMVVDKFVPNGPLAHSVAFVKYQSDQLITGSGGRFDIPELDHPGILQIMDNNEWTVITEPDFESGVTIREKSRFVDLLDAAVDPTDRKRIYVASWRSLFEIYDKKPSKHYWTENTSLVNTSSRILIDGLCFDQDNNLWFTNMLSPTGLVVKKADGTWQSFAYNDLSDTYIKETFISENGYIWVLRPRLASGTGVFVLNQNGTPFDSYDDKYKYYSTFQDVDGNSVTPNAFRCIAEDKNNEIWIGTSAGPLIVSDQRKIFDKDFTIGRIKITREDNANYADYLLGSDQINAIIVDGGNRKWLGSATSGVYLLSPDGKETLQHFTTENSPLTSNAIIDMAMNQKTGELFIATSNGLFSYMTNSTEPSEDYSNVYAYPNPVTPDFDGEISVNGLMENSLVRISDVEGKVVYEGYSNGGTFTWNGKNFDNKRVATGIYYIFAAQEDGSMKMVTKIAFIH